MTRNIKLKSKAIKKLDKSYIYSQRMKNKLVNAKEKINKENDVDENATQYAANRIFDSSSNVTSKWAYEVKKEWEIIRNKFKSKKYKEKIIENEAQRKIKLRRSAIGQKEKIFIGNSMKIKTLKSTEQTARNTQITINTANETLKNIRYTAKKIKEISKKTLIITIVSMKKIILALKSLISLIIAGGSVSVIIIVLICLIGFLFISPFGIFFSSEAPVTEDSITLESAMSDLNSEIDNEIEKIKENVKHDTFMLVTYEVKWKEILALYATISSNRETSANIMNMDSGGVQRLKDVLWNIVNVNYDTERYTVSIPFTDSEGNRTTKKVTRIRLQVYVTTKSIDEMSEKYDLSDSEKNQIGDLLNNMYENMWKRVI